MTLGLSDEELRDLIVSVGTHREDRRLSPIEVSALFTKARERGATLSECAEAVGFTGTSMVSRFLRLQDLPESVRELIDWGASPTALPFSAGAEIARLPVAAREPVARAVLAAQVGSSEVTQIVQRLLRSDQAADMAVAEILRLRPQVQRRHVFVGHVADASLETQLRALQADARAPLGAAALEAAAGPMNAELRLRPTAFVVVTDDEGARRLHSLPDFESSIIKAIADQLPPR